MSTTADTKLPAIEHIKARKDGLDVLADIYRYAELGFDAIEPDDLALFRWYGIYTQRSEAAAASPFAGSRVPSKFRFGPCRTSTERAGIGRILPRVDEGRHGKAVRPPMLQCGTNADSSQSASTKNSSPAKTVQARAGPPSRLTSGIRSEAAI